MSSSTSPLSVRILFISTVVLSAAMAARFCFPSVLYFAVYDIPVIWSVILSWLRPPYLYVVINGIIITIAATSRFHHHYNHYHNENQSSPLLNEMNYLPPKDPPSELPPMSIEPSFDALEDLQVVYEVENRETEESPVVYEIEPPVMDIETVTVNDSDIIAAETEDKFVISKYTLNTPQWLINISPADQIQSDLILPVREKPLLSSRFAHQRRTMKINPEGGRSLRVAKPRKHETLESTWKTITDGRHMPLNRHLRKSENFENYHRHASPSDVSAGEQVPKNYYVTNKSETLNDGSENENENLSLRPPSSTNSLQPSTGGKLRKEGSLSHDELNRRVEAFIKKFNEEMRLQRQESLQRYMDMINRGAE